MKALMTAFVVLGFLATADANIKKPVASQTSKIEPKAGFVCPYKSNGTVAVKPNFDHVLADATTKPAPAVKSGRAKTADGVRKS